MMKMETVYIRLIWCRLLGDLKNGLSNEFVFFLLSSMRKQNHSKKREKFNTEP